MSNKKAEMPITEIIAIVIAFVLLLVGVVIAYYFQNGGFNLGAAIYRAISFSWLFGNG
jgi:hypothetical protein